MFGIIIAACMLGFGIFLALTKNPGFARNKKFAWMFSYWTHRISI